MKTSVEGTLYEIGHFDEQPGARLELENGKILCLDGLSESAVRQLGPMLFQDVRVTIEIECVAVSEP